MYVTVSYEYNKLRNNIVYLSRNPLPARCLFAVEARCEIEVFR